MTLGLLSFNYIRYYSCLNGSITLETRCLLILFLLKSSARVTVLMTFESWTEKLKT